ncbi:hypothetical protein D1007_47785 [Hordeum vulgare]|nr:hypothetical protein D1007_47785 [Hordeum vulgare]
MAPPPLGEWLPHPHFLLPFVLLATVPRLPRDNLRCANFFGLHKFEHVEIPDGTRKKLSEWQQMDERRDWKRQLAQTLVDKYNDHHHLSGDLAYELKNVVCLESVAGGNGRRYYHINFTMKTKGADDFNCGGEDLFFGRTGAIRPTAMHDPEHAFVLSSFCQFGSAKGAVSGHA